MHLWNRRRFQTLKWAAMEFLEQALADRRRRLELRDMLLLLLRMLALALFGAALAQPFLTKEHAAHAIGLLLVLGALIACAAVAVVWWKHKTAVYLALATGAMLVVFQAGIFWSTSGEQGAPGATPAPVSAADAPVHVVLLIDNSLSMGYQSLGRSVFSAAKQRAREVLKTLPLGSEISIEPLCGANAAPATLAPSAAREALEQLRLADRAARFSTVEQIVRRYVDAAPPLPLWFVLIGDQQRENWREAPSWADGEINLHVVDVSPAHAENIWLADLYLQDDVADPLNPAVFVAEVRSVGLREAATAEVRLTVEGVEFESRTVAIPAGEAVRQISFEIALPTAEQTSGGLKHVAVSAALAHDRLSADDQRTILAPLASGLAVVFIDQTGNDESPLLGRLGETRHLRRLLSPANNNPQPTPKARRPFLKPLLLKPEEVTRERLAETRLVVVAGVTLSEELAEILAEFAWQGGRVWIAAGNAFDVASWNRFGGAARFDFLPAPLSPNPLGVSLADVAPGQTLQVFSLSFDTMRNNRLFQLAGVSEEDLAALYAEPLFFKAIQIDLPPAADNNAADNNAADNNAADNNTAAPIPFAHDQQPNWLQRPVKTWRRTFNKESLSSKGLSSRAADVDILASYDNGEPFLLSRNHGAGRVLFMTTALLSDWNTLPKTNAFLLCDRLTRSLIRETLPQVNFGGVDRITLAAPARLSSSGVYVLRPQDAQRHPLAFNQVADDQYEIVLEAPDVRGVYRVLARAENDASKPMAVETETPTGKTTAWEMAVAVNGPQEESSLKYVGPEDLAWLASSSVRWVKKGEPIRLQTSNEQASVWRWLALAALLVLLAEMASAVHGDVLPLRARWFWRTGGPQP